MTKLTDSPGSSVSQAEMRLKAAMKIAELKMEIDKYQQLEKSVSKSYISRTEMRLTAAIKIAELKMYQDKAQQLGILPAEPVEIVAAQNVTPSSTQSINKNEHHQSAIKKDADEQCKTKISESDWVDKQARRLLSEVDLRKGFTVK
jgi:hypothetical protein